MGRAAAAAVNEESAIFRTARRCAAVGVCVPVSKIMQSLQRAFPIFEAGINQRPHGGRDGYGSNEVDQFFKHVADDATTQTLSVDAGHVGSSRNMNEPRPATKTGLGDECTGRWTGPTNNLNSIRFNEPRSAPITTNQPTDETRYRMNSKTISALSSTRLCLCGVCPVCAQRALKTSW